MNDAARIVADEVWALEDKTGVASILRWRVGFFPARRRRGPIQSARPVYGKLLLKFSQMEAARWGWNRTICCTPTLRENIAIMSSADALRGAAAQKWIDRVYLEKRLDGRLMSCGTVRLLSLLCKPALV
jgi:hypothetical protein